MVTISGLEAEISFNYNTAHLNLINLIHLFFFYLTSVNEKTGEFHFDKNLMRVFNA